MKTPKSTVGSSPIVILGATRAAPRPGGFTLLELVVVFALAGLLIALSVPMGMRLYDTMSYRDAVRQVQTSLNSARYRAVTSGQSVDFMLDLSDRTFGLGEPEGKTLSNKLSLDVIYAQDLSDRDDLAVIRFYPDGSASGGSITLLRPSGVGVRLRVDWLLGRVTQEPPDDLGEDI